MRNWTLFVCIAAVAVLSLVAAAQNPLRIGAAAFGDWRADAPGIQRHIRPADLPPPKLGTDAENADVRASPRVVERPGSATPKVPAGFSADLYASGLTQPRVIRRAPNGDIFVAESGAGRVRVLRAPDGAARAAQQAMFAENLQRPYGIAFYPPGDNPRFIYIGEAHQVVRLPTRTATSEPVARRK